MVTVTLTEDQAAAIADAAKMVVDDLDDEDAENVNAAINAIEEHLP